MSAARPAGSTDGRARIPDAAGSAGVRVEPAEGAVAIGDGPAASGRVAGVRVIAPGRLHLGMLDVVGGSRRRFGGFGVAVGGPRVVAEATHAPALRVTGTEPERARAAAEATCRALGLPPAAVHVAEAVPAHAGLGSGTKLALAVARAVAVLHGCDPDPVALAAAAGRGARSAVGLWTFAGGGLVVEGGVPAVERRPSPLLGRYAVPAAWRCVLALPGAAPGMSGVDEAEVFAVLARRAGTPEDRGDEVAQLVLTALLPALIEDDVAEFGAALTRIQRLVGGVFAEAQGGVFHPAAAPLVARMLELGAPGAGQSSWGPAAYAVVADEGEGRRIADGVAELLGPGGTVAVVPFEAEGARTEVRWTSS